MEALMQKHDLSLDRMLDIVLQKEKLVNTFFDDFPSIFSIIDHNGKFVMANEYWSQLGWGKADLRDKPIQDLICEDCRHKFTDFFGGNKETVTFNCKIFNKDNKLINSNWRLKQTGENVYCTANLV